MEKNGKGPQNLDQMPKFGRFGGGANRFVPSEKPREYKKTLQRLLALFRRYRKALLGATVLTLLASSFSLVVPLYIGKAINAYDLENNLVDTSLL
ncbi:MAG: ABC transporter ATP-binding protein, partial [Proteiniclasticum sp.]|nr:ABC transporter ATP-binding protein [Proteiniclasticum sp.]